VDKLYAQVDKKRKKDGGTIHPHTPEAETAVNQDGDLRSYPSLRVYALAHVDMSSCKHVYNLLKTCIQLKACIKHYRERNISLSSHKVVYVNNELF
jgi:hypothetical protein